MTDLKSITYPAQIVGSTSNSQLDIKNNPGHRKLMYQLGGYDIDKYENKGLTMLSDYLNDLHKKCGL